MDTLLAVALAIGLAAACGLRVFVPLLVLGLAARAGWLTLSPGFGWLGGDAALLTLLAATVLEITAYYVPWLDNLLDTIAGPAAIAAGVLAAGAVLPGDPLVRWTLAGAAAGVQLLTTTARALSSAATAGLANWALATVEAVGAVVLALLALALPLLAALLALALLAQAARGARRLAARSS